jgi:hypothetical protein
VLSSYEGIGLVYKAHPAIRFGTKKKILFFRGRGLGKSQIQEERSVYSLSVSLSLCLSVSLSLSLTQMMITTLLRVGEKVKDIVCFLLSSLLPHI